MTLGHEADCGVLLLDVLFHRDKCVKDELPYCTSVSGTWWGWWKSAKAQPANLFLLFSILFPPPLPSPSKAFLHLPSQSQCILLSAVSLQVPSNQLKDGIYDVPSGKPAEVRRYFSFPLLNTANHFCQCTDRSHLSLAFGRMMSMDEMILIAH